TLSLHDALPIFGAHPRCDPLHPVSLLRRILHLFRNEGGSNDGAAVSRYVRGVHASHQHADSVRALDSPLIISLIHIAGPAESLPLPRRLASSDVEPVEQIDERDV